MAEDAAIAFIWAVAGFCLVKDIQWRIWEDGWHGVVQGLLTGTLIGYAVWLTVTL